MRTDDRQPRKKSFADAYVFAALVIASFSLLLLSTRSFIVDFRDLGLSAFTGIRGGIHGLSSGVSRTFLSIKELADLRRDYAELLGRMERYEQLERDSAEIRQENIRLREQLDFSQSLRYRHISAEVIGRDPDNLFSAFVVNKGSRDGIKRNMPVIAYQGGVQGLVGKVVQVGRRESLVMPVYDSFSFVSARMADSRYEGIVAGLGSADRPLLLRYIKKRAREELNFGDVVVTSGLGGVYPKGLSIGRVSKILFQDYETSLEVELESSIDFSRLEYVFIMEKESEGEEDE